MIVWGELTPLGAIRVYGRWREELAEGFRPGERLRISIDRDRNGKFNSLFHLMLGLIAKAINRGPAETDIDRLKQWVKLQRGWFEVKKLPQPINGVDHAIAYKSTSFAKMTESEFHRFAVDTCELIRDQLAPWIADAPEWAEARSIIDSIAPEEAA